MKLRKIVLGLALGLPLLGLAAYLIEAERALRPFRSITPQGGASCRRVEVEGLVGAEDMEFDHPSATLWIAAANRRGSSSFRPHDSAFFRWRPDAEPAPVRVSTAGFGGPLRLHGMGLSRQPSGELRVLSIQHGDDGEGVEIFRAEKDGDRDVLRHVRSVRAPSFISLNDVAATGPESFYVTNDHGSPAGLGHKIEDFGMLSRASLVYFDGSAARTVQSGLRYANGVTVDPTGRYVIVSEATARRLSVFTRAADGGVTLASRTSLDTSPDNLSLDENGAYYVGAHPSTFQFLRHAKDAARPSASHALRFWLGANGQLSSAETLWLDDGRVFSGSSVAAVRGNLMIVGGVFDRGVLVCQLR